VNITFRKYKRNHTKNYIYDKFYTWYLFFDGKKQLGYRISKYENNTRYTTSLSVSDYKTLVEAKKAVAESFAKMRTNWDKYGP